MVKGFVEFVVKYISEIIGLFFVFVFNKFVVLVVYDGIVMVSGVLKILVCLLLKIVNDIWWLGSGFRCGFGELILFVNELGFFIMLGKVNFIQCEVMMMVVIQVMGYDVVIILVGVQGNFELNIYKLMMIFNLIQLINLIVDSCNNFIDFFLVDLKLNRKKIEFYLENFLMLVIVLSLKIGYDWVVEVVYFVYEKDLILK